MNVNIGVNVCNDIRTAIRSFGNNKTGAAVNF